MYTGFTIHVHHMHMSIFCDIVFCYYLAFLCFYIKNFVNYHYGKILCF